MVALVKQAGAARQARAQPPLRNLRSLSPWRSRPIPGDPLQVPHIKGVLPTLQMNPKCNFLIQMGLILM
jgi:hypothetical protein